MPTQEVTLTIAVSSGGHSVSKAFVVPANGVVGVSLTSTQRQTITGALVTLAGDIEDQFGSTLT